MRINKKDFILSYRGLTIYCFQYNLHALQLVSTCDIFQSLFSTFLPGLIKMSKQWNIRALLMIRLNCLEKVEPFFFFKNNLLVFNSEFNLDCQILMLLKWLNHLIQCVMALNQFAMVQMR